MNSNDQELNIHVDGNHVRLINPTQEDCREALELLIQKLPKRERQSAPQSPAEQKTLTSADFDQDDDDGHGPYRRSYRFTFDIDPRATKKIALIKLHRDWTQANTQTAKQEVDSGCFVVKCITTYDAEGIKHSIENGCFARNVQACVLINGTWQPIAV